MEALSFDTGTHDRRSLWELGDRHDGVVVVVVLCSGGGGGLGAPASTLMKVLQRAEGTE